MKVEWILIYALESTNYSISVSMYFYPLFNSSLSVNYLDKSELYGGCKITSQPTLNHFWWMAKDVCGVALSWWKITPLRLTNSDCFSLTAALGKKHGEINGKESRHQFHVGVALLSRWITGAIQRCTDGRANVKSPNNDQLRQYSRLFFSVLLFS